MKKVALFVILLITTFKLFAQQKDKLISIGYYAPYAIQSGVKIGSFFNIKEWVKEKDVKLKFSSLFISPQIGVFFRPRNHTSFVLNADMGYKITNSKQNFYISPSLGFGYLIANQVLSNTITLNSGDVAKRDRELRHYFLPTINFGFGNYANKKIGWYTKLSFGRKMSPTIEDATFFAFELGLKFNLLKTETTHK
ncbi:MAG: hypothetical protein GY810_10330 [Aureispira sp.]|nr:hypothetical protein [Aureispira sp.]